MNVSFNLRGLNQEQRGAVETVVGPLLLLAGAGTGKTRVITYRVAYLISRGVAPGNILAVTFTNKAAREMKERLGALLNAEQARLVTAATFHSFCARILRAKIRLLGYSPQFQIAPEGYQTGLVKNVLGELGVTREGLNAQYCLNLISRAKSRLLLPADIPADGVDWPSELPAVYERYQQQMKNMDMVDFDDLLLLVVRLWREHPDVLAQHQEHYQYLLIDEYQDTNAVQFQLMFMLAAKHQNICAVGDDDQSIYGWRGADLGNILRFEEYFPKAKVIRLEQNYRSTTTILQAANAVIAHNQERHGKRLWSGKGTGEKILLVRAADELAEANFVAEFVRDRRAVRGGGYRQFAALYRSNHQSRLLEDAMRRARIPYRLIGSRSFYQRKEILDAVSFLCVMQNPKDNQSLLRIINVPPRGIGDKSIERLKQLHMISSVPLQKLMVAPEFLNDLPADTATRLRHLHSGIEKYRREAAACNNLAGMVRGFLEDVGYLEGLGRMYKPREDAIRRRENVFEFFNAIAEFEKRWGPNATLNNFLEQFMLLDDNDKVDGEEEDAVTLMTVHAAKGLEFPVLVVVGLEQGLFPHQQSMKEGGLEEERRLFYVAVTRAQEELALVHADKRRVLGETMTRRPSRFLEEIPEDLAVVCDTNSAMKPASAEVAAEFLARMKEMFAVK